MRLLHSKMVRKGEEEENPFRINVSVDGMVILIFLVGLYTRFVSLDKPKNVVFDEMHYGKYASLYLKRTFFFDANPPLGKLLVASAGYLANYQGNFTFDKIGVEYPSNIPLWCFRFFPAFCGSAISPMVYLILCQLKLSPWSGFLAGFMVLFDTALLAQSRFILLDTMMIIFCLMSLYSVLKFRQYQDSPFRLGWTFWLITAVISMGCAFSVKYLALYTIFLCIWILSRNFWKRLRKKELSNWKLFAEFSVQAILVTVVPLAIYIGCFYVHLSILTKAGLHDTLMTSTFQASLEGGLSSIVKGQPVAVAHGSQITLRHTFGKTCWLHSHEHVYPIKYGDSRGSSHQQQVSCYGYKDVNNWWIVKRPDREDLAVHEPLDIIKDGDEIQLVHGLTHRALNSHDVAAPMSPSNQEVSCYIDYNISMPAENLWRVDIYNLGSGSGGNSWHSINSQVRLIHVTTGQALKFSGKMYPDWGFHQLEVVADKNVNQLDTVWNVEEHRYTKNDEDKRAIERELITSELIPMKPTTMTFWEKFLELQIKMLITNQENIQNHNYASDPSEWPFLSRGIAYFIAKDSNAQVHLLGNIVIWYSGSLAVISYSALFIFYLLRRRRLCLDLPENMWNQFLEVSEVLLAGYFFHYIPFFFYDRTLFLHHYLPAYIYKIMLTAFLIHHTFHIIRNIFKEKILSKAFIFCILLWGAGILYVFSRLSLLSYGIKPLSASEVRDLRWKDTWDLIIHKA